jgi:mannose-6-phosphate isomerase-like protein (cupin superfamily)
MSPTDSRAEVRPWGSYEVLSDESATWKVKYLTVLPGRRLSYQSHEHRAEHWTVVQGTAEVLLDGETHLVEVGSCIVVPRGAKHRCGNPGTVDLIFVEVQIGDYFGEDDIVRYEDDYGRVG